VVVVVVLGGTGRYFVVVTGTTPHGSARVADGSFTRLFETRQSPPHRRPAAVRKCQRESGTRSLPGCLRSRSCSFQRAWGRWYVQLAVSVLEVSGVPLAQDSLGLLERIRERALGLLGS